MRPDEGKVEWSKYKRLDQHAVLKEGKRCDVFCGQLTSSLKQRLASDLYMEMAEDGADMMLMQQFESPDRRQRVYTLDAKIDSAGSVDSWRQM